MFINEITSNKTFTDLYGDHLNNVVVFGDDSRTDKFYAHIEMEFWGEDSITIEDETASGVTALKDDKITLDLPDRKIEWYQDKKSTGENTWRSLLKWVIHLKTKPLTNKYSLKLGGNWQDFNFRYQTPFPNPTEFVKDGEEWLRQETIPGAPGFNHRRPRKVDGSYSVKHKTKRDHIIGQKNYRTGKVLHIYVPKATDANNKSVWCNLYIEKGIYTVTISQEFLDEAIYPVIVNDTFGYATIGGTGFDVEDETAVGWKATCPSDGTADNIVVYTGITRSGNFKGMLMNNTGTLLANGVGGATAFTPEGWFTSTFSSSPDVVASTEYGIGVIADSYIMVQYDGGSGGWYDESNSYASPENCTFENWDADVSIYVNYTPSVGANAPTGVLQGALVGCLGGPI